jgi:hypothetical protein
MRNSPRTGFETKKWGVLVLGACTAWLVIQNTLLILAMLWVRHG